MYDTIDDRTEVDRAFEALKAATPRSLQGEFERMMLMGRRGDVHDFKHKDMRRSFGFDIVTGEFSGEGQEGPITSAEEAYSWASN